jgi:Type II secretory pathway, prepilin signal peptidase PulO and related peptidases
MIYIINLFIAIVSCVFVIRCAQYKNVIAQPLTFPQIFNNDMTSDEEQRTLFKGKRLIVLIILMLGTTFVAGLLVYSNSANWLNYIKLMSLFAMVQAAAIIDLKLKIIPNRIILIGLSLRLIFYILEFTILRKEILKILLNDLIGFAIGFGILFAVALITSGGIGFGDAKLFAVIGLTSGAICTYATLLISMVVSTIVSVTLLLLKKKSRKDTISFGPSIAAGYFITLILGSY